MLQEAMNETFYLSNILPQNYENNAGTVIWVSTTFTTWNKDIKPHNF